MERPPKFARFTAPIGGRLTGREWQYAKGIPAETEIGECLKETTAKKWRERPTWYASQYCTLAYVLVSSVLFSLGMGIHFFRELKLTTVKST